MTGISRPVQALFTCTDAISHGTQQSQPERANIVIHAFHGVGSLKLGDTDKGLDRSGQQKRIICYIHDD
jgi:hypothetical protein